MSFITNIKLKIGNFLLPKRAGNILRNSTFHNLESAKSISILFDARNQQDFQAVKKYIDSISLQKKDISALGLLETENPEGSFVHKDNVSFFTQENLSWSGVVEDKAVKEFISQPSDILIDLSLSDNYHMKYITALSPAKMKISDNSKETCCDLTFDISKNKSVSYLTEQITHYLNLIKKA